MVATKSIKSSTLPGVLHSSTVNQQFHKSKSQYVDLATRLTTSIRNDAFWTHLIDATVEEFNIRSPHIKKWSDFELCLSQATTLDKIVIDTTLQRILNITHVTNILDYFQPVKVMAISVYEDPAAPGKYVCWDGQHTATALYIIASRSLGLDLSKCIVPITIYKSCLKSEMRESFIALNSDAKLPLDQIDIYQQMLFGVRTDSSKKPEWVLAESKQQALEKANMFATNAKFCDTDKPGALSRLDELSDKKYDLIITQQFCKYFVAVCGSNRPVQPKECWMLYDYFKLCQTEGILVDDNYIKGIADSLNISGNGNFDSKAIAKKAKESYNNWYCALHQIPVYATDGKKTKIKYSESDVLPFLIKQISKNFSGVVPTTADTWAVPTVDLL
jgi:hypothetical protein